MISAVPINKDLFDDTVETDKEDQETEGTLSGVFDLNAYKFETMLSRLKSQLKNPELSSEKLSKIIDKLFKIEERNNISDSGREALESIFSSVLDKLESMNVPILLDEYLKRLRGRGYSVSGVMTPNVPENKSSSTLHGIFAGLVEQPTPQTAQRPVTIQRVGTQSLDLNLEPPKPSLAPSPKFGSMAA